MGFFGQVAKQSSDLYGRLNFSQKAAFVLLIAVVVFALVLFASWGSRGDYLRVTREPLGAARAEVVAAFDAAGISYREDAGGLEVPASRYNEAVAILAMHNIVPTETLKIRFEDVAKDDKMFRTSADKRAQRLIALQNGLADIIAKMDNIRQATVGLDAPDAPGWLGEEDRGSASVQVWLRSGVDQLSKRQVNGIASLVAGMRRSIRKSDVNIVDQTGRPYRVAAGDAADGNIGDRHEQQLTFERRLGREVCDMLGYFSPVKVMVRLKINFDKQTVQEKDYGTDGYGETLVTKRKLKNTSTSGDGAVVATTPGKGTSLGTAGPTKNDITEENTSARKVNEKITSIVKATGTVEDASVTVFVPREQVLEQIKARGVAEDAAPAEIPKELDDIKASLASMLMVSDPKNVTVRAVVFPKPKAAEEEAAQGFMASFWPEHGRSAVLGVLSLVALVLLWRMVKRPVEVTAGPTRPYAAEQMLAGLEPVGGAPDASEMVDRKVNDMVRDNPTDAANLITRWVQSEG